VSAHIHERTFRVAMAEVDVAQIHFTALHRWIDRGMSEWLAEIGHPFTRLLEEGPGVPIVNITTRIGGRILLDDLITQRTWIGAAGRSSFRSRHRFLRDGEVMAESELVHVCVDRVTRETLPVPEWLRTHVVDDPVQVAPRD
jgi:acyl-CoA thioesterase FadM